MNLAARVTEVALVARAETGGVEGGQRVGEGAAEQVAPAGGLVVGGDKRQWVTGAHGVFPHAVNRAELAAPETFDVFGPPFTQREVVREELGQPVAARYINPAERVEGQDRVGVG